MKAHPRFRGARVTVGTPRWRESFFNHAFHLRQYFREYAAELTLEERRKLAISMGLPVIREPEPTKRNQSEG
jgi:hypothetical protein